MNAVAVLFHFGFLGLYVYVSYLLHYGNKDNPYSKEYKSIETLGKFSMRYLTNWTFAMQMIYFLIRVIGYFFGAVGASRIKAKIHLVSDFLFISISTPMAYVVSLVFWGWYAVDRELVFPKELDLVIPVWVNQVIHSSNTLCTFVDMALTDHKMPSWKASIYGLLGYLLAYSICLFGTYFESGIWLYPFLKGMSWTIRVVFAFITIALALFMLLITRTIHTLFWGKNTTGGGRKKEKLDKPKKK